MRDLKDAESFEKKVLRRLEMPEAFVARSGRSHYRVQRIVVGMDDMKKSQASGDGASAERECTGETVLVAAQQVVEQRSAVVSGE